MRCVGRDWRSKMQMRFATKTSSSFADDSDMPLLDHFHAPLHPQRHWEAFHSRWASAIADALNADLLPPEYFAEPETHATDASRRLRLT